MSVVDAALPGAETSTTPDISAVWREVIDELSAAAPSNRGFLNTTQALGLLQRENGATFLLEAPNTFTKDFLELKIKSSLNEILSQKFNQTITIAVQVNEALEVESVEEVEADPTTPNLETHRQGTGRGADSKRPQEPSQLNPRYIFETFVIGASNRFAHAAAVAVAEAPAKAYNPLFIYGESGLGKTHLLHAIGAYAKELYGSVRVRYVSSEEFTNDFINSIRDDKAAVFKQRYRDLDILLVDDIQFLENK